MSQMYFEKKDIILILLGLIVFSYSILRAYNTSFTHDEALTYSIVKHNSNWKETANNHFINTYLIKVTALFSENELALRFPNILAHLVYIIVSFLLVKRMNGFPFRVGAFIILNFSLPLLEFFSLARGYGLAHCCLLLSIYYLNEFLNNNDKRNRTAAGLAVLFGSLCILGNLILINYLIALNVTIFLARYFTYTGSPFFTISKLKNCFLWVLPLFIYSTIFMFLIWLWINNLQTLGELYFGGYEGLFDSIFGSILNNSMYGISEPFWLKPLMAVIVAIGFVFLTVLSIKDLIADRRLTLHSAVWLIIIITLFLSFIQHISFKTPYPTGRTALFFLVLIFTSHIFGIYTLYNSNGLIRKAVSVAMISATAFLVFYIFSMQRNLTTTFSFADDSRTKEMMRDLYCTTNHAEPLSLGVNWIFEPSVNFYREANKMENWMSQANRAGVSEGLYSYYYCFTRDTSEIPESQNLMLIKHYPETNTVLLRRDPRRTLVYSKEFAFPELKPNTSPDSYSEIFRELPPINANDFINVEVLPFTSEISEQMKAHLILLQRDNWQNTLVFHNHITGSSGIVLKNIAQQQMPSPVVIYRNWQDSLTIPAVKIKVEVYR